MNERLYIHWFQSIIITLVVLMMASIAYAQEAAEPETLSATEIEQIRDQLETLSNQLEKALKGKLEERDEALLERLRKLEEELQKRDKEFEQREEEMQKLHEHRDRELEQLMKQKDKALEHGLQLKEKELKEVMKVHEKAMQEQERAMQRMEREMERAMRQMEKEMRVEVPDMPHGASHNHSGAFDSFQGHKIKEKLENEFEVTLDDRLMVRNKFGSIYITAATEASTMHVKVDQHTGADTKEQAQTILEAMKINIEKDQDEIVVEVDARNGGNYDGHILAYCDIYVSTPKLAEIETHNQFGSTYLQGIEGVIDTHNSFGSTIFENCKSELNIENSHGSLQLKQHTGNIDIQNSFGSLMINGLKAETADIESQYGETKIRGLQPDIQLSGEFGFGPVWIVLPKEFNGKVIAENRMAPIHTPEHWNVEGNNEGGVSKSQPNSVPQAKVNEEMKVHINIPHPPKMEREIEVVLGNGPGIIDVESQFGPIHFEQEQ